MSDIEKLLLNTQPLDRSKTIEAVNSVYKFCKLSPPNIVFADGPTQLKQWFNPDEEPLSFFDHYRIAIFGGRRYVGRDSRLEWPVKNALHNAAALKKRFGHFIGSSHISMPDYMRYGDRGYKDREVDYEFKVMTNLWDNSYAIVSMKGTCYILERPVLAIASERGWHCKGAPALVFKDGTEFYFYEGVQVPKEYALDPSKTPLSFIHQEHSSDKHILIDMVGVDEYLEMVKGWKPPSVEGKFQSFHGFHEMVVPGDDDIKETWKRKGRGWMYEDEEKETKEPYKITITQGQIDDSHGYLVYNETFPHHIDFYDRNFKSKLERPKFCPDDQELLDHLDIKEIFGRMHGGELSLSYHNKVFSLKSNRLYNDNFPSCKHDVAPAWFKAKIFRRQEAYYENEEYGYAVKWEPGEKGIGFAGNIQVNERGSRHATDPIPTATGSLFGGCENIPHYDFDIDLSSDSWEGLLVKWAELSFKWIGMCEDSTRCG